MKLDDYKDQLKDKWNEFYARLEESPSFNTLREKYEGLSPNTQKGVWAGIVFVLVCCAVYFPYTYYSASLEYEAEYTDNQELIRQLLKASRQAAESSTVPPSWTVGQTVAKIQGDLQTMTLLPEQIESVETANPAAFGPPIVPTKIKTDGVLVKLKTLNLRQIIDIGYFLQSMSPNVKLVGTEVRATTADNHYYDVMYKVAVYSLQGLGLEGSTSGKGRQTGKDKKPTSRRNKAQPPPDEEEDPFQPEEEPQ